MIALFIIIFPNVSNAVCTGRFVNPVTDVCWDCIFPISIGASEMPRSTTFRPDTENFPSPICVCPNAKLLGVPTPGLAVGFWEPIRMVDVTKRPFCMTSIGGIELNPGLDIGTGSAPYENEGEGRIGNWHVHWYINPLTSILNIFNEILCDFSGIATYFDLAYLTELDPLWNNDILAFILNPEAILFGNIVAQAVCAADCVASTVWKPLDVLFWCAGCQGAMYPFTGNNSEHMTSIQSSSLSVERFTFKLHRQLMAWNTSGPEAICSPIPAPIIKKSQYRLQTTIPIPGIGPYGCNPYGRSTMLHDSFKEIPIAGEDFGYFVWRKRTCCMQ
ncbi:MAG: TraU family protein [Proteobacteria bacterium]|nr:TraU family protein [Pseudomonadota bacterium]